MSCEYIRLCTFSVLNGESCLELVGAFDTPIFYKLKSFLMALAGYGRADAGDVLDFISCRWKSDLCYKLGVRL